MKLVNPLLAICNHLARSSLSSSSVEPGLYRIISKEGGIRIFGFAVFVIFLDRFFGFVPNKLRFYSFGLWFADFRVLALGFRFSSKIPMGFQIWSPK